MVGNCRLPPAALDGGKSWSQNTKTKLLKLKMQGKAETNHERKCRGFSTTETNYERRKGYFC